MEIRSHTISLDTVSYLLPDVATDNSLYEICIYRISAMSVILPKHILPIMTIDSPIYRISAMETDFNKQ